MDGCAVDRGQQDGMRKECGHGLQVREQTQRASAGPIKPVEITVHWVVGGVDNAVAEREGDGEGFSRSSLWMQWGGEDHSKRGGGIVALTSIG